jgi:hypothetical protein
MLGKKLGKHFDRMGYKLGSPPMVMGGKMQHMKMMTPMQPMEPEKPMYSDLEKRHPEHEEEQLRRHHHH